jgi:hypothetical protein
MKTKTHDCIKMKREAQEKIRAAVAKMDRRGEIEYFRAGAEEFEQQLQAARAKERNRVPDDEGPP